DALVIYHAYCRQNILVASALPVISPRHLREVIGFAGYRPILHRLVSISGDHPSILLEMLFLGKVQELEDAVQGRVPRIRGQIQNSLESRCAIELERVWHRGHA